MVYYILKFTGVLVLSKNPTFANLPNIPRGSYSLSSNLFSPKIGDFIVYKFNDLYLGNHKRVHRLCGFQNDTVEIKKGDVFLNGKNMDKNFNLIHCYKISKHELDNNYGNLSDYSLSTLIKEDSINFKILLEGAEVEKFNLNVTRAVDGLGDEDREISKIFNEPWNKDNFGPIVIPKNKVFVLGDNRDNNFDSRNVGFIDEHDIEGVFLKIF
jgi:signal peptidase I